MRNKNLPGYKAVHKWIKRHYGSATYCSECDIPSKRYEWANISGECRREITDYKQLCASCHRKMDYTEEQRKNRSLGKLGKPLYKLRIPVTQLTLDGKVVDTFDSPIEASAKTGIGLSVIYGARNGHQKTAGGFKWIKAN